MIKKLSVSNYALIDHLEAEPSPGLSIVTGETGAGKSILLGAIGLATGSRADLSALRDPGAKCVVELTVDIASKGLEDFFSDNDLDYEPQTILRREILPSGKSRAFVNDTPVLLETLSALSAHLVDIHSQHQSLLLSRPDYRTGVLDHFSGDDVPLTQYREAFARRRKIAARLEELSVRGAELSKTQDYNRYLLEELDLAALGDPSELEELETLAARLSNSRQIQADLFSLGELLGAEQFGVLPRLSESLALLRRNEKYLPDADQLPQRTESALIELKDIAARIDTLLSDTEDDPALLERTTARTDTLNALLRKHNAPDMAGLILRREALRGEVAGLDETEEEIAVLRKESAHAEQQLKQAAGILTRIRTEAAGLLAEGITDTVRQLGMPNAVFDIRLRPASALSSLGAEEIDFLFSANLGQQPAPVEKVASGGELSRIMMALKYTLARRSQLPCVIFDEIDTGVSGDVADRMGRIMQEMSHHMQVISITHLPQIASRGEIHYKVFKVEKDGTTQSGISLLGTEERIRELAGMISGSEVTEAAMEHARVLLTQNGGRS